MEKPSWDDVWMGLASTIALKSHDDRLQVGCIIVSDDNSTVLAVGYNGNYAGGPHEPASREPGMSEFIHAEVNAAIKCDFNNPKRKIVYTTHSPCRACCKILVNLRIAKVVYRDEYRDTSGLDILRSCGIEVVRYAGT